MVKAANPDEIVIGDEDEEEEEATVEGSQRNTFTIS